MWAKSQAPGKSRITIQRQKFNQNPPSSSNSSSSDSSEDSEDSDSLESSSESDSTKQCHDAKKKDKYRKKHRELKRKMRKAQRASIKLKEPTAYRGQGNYDDFELWDYETEQWLKESGFKGQRAVQYLGSFLKDKAAQWYMDFIAPDPESYSVGTLKMGLFAYCFPPDLKSKLWKEFKGARQGFDKFVDYLRTLKRLQRQMPDITDRQLCIKLWDTVQAYIKIKWIEAGMDAEVIELAALAEIAERSEAAEEVKQRTMIYRGPENPRHTTPHLIPRSMPSPKGRQNSAPGRNNYPPPQNTQRPQNNPRGNFQPQLGPSARPQGRPRDPKPKSDKNKMLREERNELRAEGKCFSCKEKGHTVKDCPSQTTAKPTGMYSVALQYDYELIEKLRKQRAEPVMNVASIRPETPKDTGSSSVSTSYGTLNEIPTARLLLTKILDEITPYARVVVAEDDRFRITNDQVTVELTYAEIARQVRGTYLVEAAERTRAESENNQTLPTIPEELVGSEWELAEWSESDEETQKPIHAPSTQLNALRVDNTNQAGPSTSAKMTFASKRWNRSSKVPLLEALQDLGIASERSEAAQKCFKALW
jgi:hypothetical protein